ncbi:ATP-binding protein [Allokutzneria albata]|uniref:Non-specific serine/threonine protein kinase n=1 Tax=Allokutzneria albata TaxID=211114 RepID=A0A1G9S9C1_ALLAB|nr:LuxR C-terminal-related transcriptional regulator [Allokutzneria albata]SDM31907.1 non-specific serine/threonine protein kinase [Allokutzneria albata]
MIRQQGVLPVEVSSFVNRREERDALRSLVRTSRLVTVTGVGGVGKTRVALRVAAEVRKDFPDGVWWVDLSPLRDAALLPHLVANVLGVQDVTLRPMEQVLADAVASRRMMLVLDTCEHLRWPCARLVDALLRAASQLRVLATSRQSLGVAGETVYTVRPMRLRPQGHDGVADGVELFVERARAASGSFALTAENRDVVAQLCHRLDGLPLAIELAAVRSRALSVHEILGRLDDHFDLLAGGVRVLPERHETLRTTIGWSYQLCTPAERLLWARVSVFSGAVDLSGLVEVCTDDRLVAGDVLRTVDGLVDKSILLREGRTGEVRYRLLDTLRAFGRQRQRQTGEQAWLLRRHRDYYLRLAKRFEVDWCSPRQIDWRERMQREYENLRAAIDFCLSTPSEHLAGLELLGALREFWVGCGVVREGRHHLDRALALNVEPGPVLTTALWTAAWLAVAQGDLEAVDTLLARCRPYAERQGDTVAAGWIAYIAGAAAMFRGHHTEAVALTEESAELHRRSGAPGTGLAAAYSVQAMALAMAGEFDRAVVAAEQCRAASERCGEYWMRSYADYMRAVSELGRGDPEAAVTYARTALRSKHLLGDSPGMAMALDLLASAAAAQGQAERAARLLGVGHQVWNTFGLSQFGSADLVSARRHCELQTRTALGSSGYQAAFEAGQSLELDAAIAYALDEHTPCPHAPSPADVEPLTRRERDVATLVSDGLTNKEIAARLGIAKRTVDIHIGRVLAKLSFDNRAQIAEWVRRLRPTTGP